MMYTLYTHDADASTAMETLIAYAPKLGQSGGIDIYVPSGVHTFVRPILLTGLSNVRLSGPGELRYAGEGQTPFISLASSQRIAFRDLTISYSHPGFTGPLVACGHSPALGSDPGYLHFEGLSFQGVGGAVNAATCLDLGLALMVTVNRCRFTMAKVGIAGVTSGYSNVVTIGQGTTFMHLGEAGIKNAGEAWLIQNCCFEPLASGQSGAYVQDLSYWSRGLTFDTCWFGDVGQPGRSWITARSLGLKVTGCQFGSPGTGPADVSLRIAAGQGVKIDTCRFEGLRAMDFSLYYSYGVVIDSCDFQGAPFMKEMIMNPKYSGNAGLANKG